MDLKSPIFSRVGCNLWNSSMISDEEEIAGRDKALGIQIFELGFTVEWMVACQTDQSFIARNPVVW
jgi:hypothetical protein